MIRLELKKLANLLQDGQYHTAFWLAENMGTSDKTIRKRLAELEDTMKDCILIS